MHDTLAWSPMPYSLPRYGATPQGPWPALTPAMLNLSDKDRSTFRHRKHALSFTQTEMIKHHVFYSYTPLVDQHEEAESSNRCLSAVQIGNSECIKPTQDRVIIKTYLDQFQHARTSPLTLAFESVHDIL